MTREPLNQFDHNAIKVSNSNAKQIGHLPRYVANSLAFIVDNGLASING